MTKTVITENTEKILSLRKDDYRVSLIHDIMYGDDIGGSHPERKFIVTNASKKEETYFLRKADIYDSLAYEKVASVEDMKAVIEANISSLQRMKKNGAMPGMLQVKDVWVMLFTTDKNGEDIQLNTYFNPDANDCGDILRTERNVVLVGFILTYPTKASPDAIVPEGTPDELYEFTFFSPLDQANLSEYERIALQEEAKNLQDMFLIKFDASQI